MKILVYPHDLGMGGSQHNAIELAAAVRERGHEVCVYGRPGVLSDRIEALGLDFVESPPVGRRPDVSVVRDLRRLVASKHFDVIHGYEWPPILEARLGLLGSHHSAAVGTVMSMAVAPFIPRNLPLVVGTRQIAAHERQLGRRGVEVIEPPVDLGFNHAHGVDVEAFRRAFDIPTGLHIVVVSRLADELKLEGLLTAIAETPALRTDAVLTVVGDGPARDRVQEAAATANRRAGRRAVVLTGQVADPRPAYAMADIALGMGGSALRAMAFGAPLVVQGEQGFWSTLTPETLGTFGWTGWYGVGDGVASGSDRYREVLSPLLRSAQLRGELGAFALDTVQRHFSLTRAAELQERVYERALVSANQSGATTADFAGAARFVQYKSARWRDRITKSPSTDDFNARPVATSMRSNEPLIVHYPGVAWDGIEGTDHRLVEGLSGRIPLLWVDPPRPLTRRFRPHPGVTEPKPGLERVAPGVWRLHILTTPGVTRPFLRTVARLHQSWSVRRACRTLGYEERVGLVAHPSVDVRDVPAGLVVYLATDDFVAGATLLGLDEDEARRRVACNVDGADLVLAVSPHLAARLGGPTSKVRVFPNGCPLPEAHQSPVPAWLDDWSGPVAGVVGQLNERLDLELLLDLADKGTNLLLVGPRYEQSPETRALLDDLVSKETVRWVGRQPYHSIPSYLAGIDVGLTPYRDDEFNRSSFPLKTLEYLAAGVRVVSTDLPSARWLNTEMVDVAASKAEFLDLCLLRLAQGRDSATSADCRAVARNHTWSRRAEELVQMIHELRGGGVALPTAIPTKESQR